MRHTQKEKEKESTTTSTKATDTANQTQTDNMKVKKGVCIVLLHIFSFPPLFPTATAAALVPYSFNVCFF
jgi:hypothetical protein